MRTTRDASASRQGSGTGVSHRREGGQVRNVPVERHIHRQVREHRRCRRRHVKVCDRLTARRLPLEDRHHTQPRRVLIAEPRQQQSGGRRGEGHRQQVHAAVEGAPILLFAAGRAGFAILLVDPLQLLSHTAAAGGTATPGRGWGWARSARSSAPEQRGGSLLRGMYWRFAAAGAPNAASGALRSAESRAGDHKQPT